MQLGLKRLQPCQAFMPFLELTSQGRFAGKGKLNCWKALSRCSEEVVSAFAALGTTEELTANTESAIEAFVYQLYESGTTVVDVGDLRWKLFTNKQLETRSCHPHEQLCMKPLPVHIFRLWCGIRTTRPTHSYHQQRVWVEGREGYTSASPNR